MYEKGNVSIREEKKYRECSIRVVTSKNKLLVTTIFELGKYISLDNTKAFEKYLRRNSLVADH